MTTLRIGSRSIEISNPDKRGDPWADIYRHKKDAKPAREALERLAR